MSNDYEMRDTATIKIIPAECSRGCYDPECPYTHTPAWYYVGDFNRLFNTRKEAVEHARAFGEFEI